MDAMPMVGGTMTAWVPMCGESWIGAAAAFIGTWSVMMAAMMLPSLLPMLWRYHQAAGRSGEQRIALLTALLGGGYLLVWSLLGVLVYPLGAAVAAVTMRHPPPERAVPIAIGLVVLIAGALQFTRWKTHHLACCRKPRWRESPESGRPPPGHARGALRHGLRLGLHCGQCCAGLTAVLLVLGMMDLPAVISVTAAITLERLAPAGERIARVIGVVVTGGGLFLILRAAGAG